MTYWGNDLRTKEKKSIKTTPYPFQDNAIEAIQEFGGRAGLFVEMGLGKSPISLWWAERYLPKDAGPVIVICPASLKYNWQDEIWKHRRKHAIVLETTRPDLSQAPTNKSFYIVNYDVLGKTGSARTGPGWGGFLKELTPSLVVCDESHSLSNPRNKRTKWVRKLCEGVPHILMLTGTPLSNRPAELWPLLNILRPDLYPNFWDYAWQFCAPKKTPWGSGWDFGGAANLDVLHKNLKKQLMWRCRKRDVLPDLPPITRSVVPLEITKPKEYHKAVHDFLGWLKQQDPAKAARAARAEKITQLSYLRRLAAELKLKNALSWVDEFLQESDGKILLFAMHHSVVTAVEERYGKKCVSVTGLTPKKERPARFRAFNTDKKIRVFIGNYKAAGVGWSCTSSSTVAHLEFPWVPPLITQAESRPHGIGRGEEGVPVMSYSLVARGTIEEDLCKMLQEKQGVADATLDGGPVAESLDIFDLLTEKLLGKL